MRSQPESKRFVGDSREENAEIVRRVLNGVEQGSPRSAVLVNAAAAFYVGGQTSLLREGVQAAAASIDSGAAAETLEGSMDHHLEEIRL